MRIIKHRSSSLPPHYPTLGSMMDSEINYLNMARVAYRALTDSQLQ